MNRNLTVIVIYLFSLSLIKTTQAQSIDDLLSKIFSTPRLQPQPDVGGGKAQSIDDLLSKIYSTPRPQPQPDVGGRKACGLNKECVDRFLCDKNGAVIRNGETVIDIRSGDENSCNYLEVCCSTEEKLTKPNVPIKPAETHTGCGYRNPSGVGFRITGDKDGESQFGEFPWMVAILRVEVIGGETFNIYECGGSVIAPNVVLTAAHCAQTPLLHLYTVRAGEWDSRTTQEVLPHQNVRVKEIIRHENYNKGALYNDVALFILATPFTWAENVRPICLPEPDANFDYSRCFATGWGKTQFGKGSPYPMILKKIELPTVPHDVCQANLRKTRLGRFFQLHRSFMCAGGEKGKDTCKGDGGSPLVCPDPNNPKRYYQAGIVAWGIGCGAINVPGVYANVAYLRNWINTNLTARGIDFQHFTV